MRFMAQLVTRPRKATGRGQVAQRSSHRTRARWSALVLALGASLMLSVSAAAAPTDVSGTWSCCGSGGAGVQTWVITESGSGALTGNGLTPSGSVFATITGSVSGSNVTVVTTYNSFAPGYVATFVGTLSADGSTLSGSWSSNDKPPQTGTWTATRKRASATQVSCYDTNPGAPTDFFQCTAAVGDASGQSTADTPTGTVAFALNPGAAGGFQGSSTCTLAPSQTGGPVGFCSVDYVPPTGGIPVGSQPPVTAAYTGDGVFGASSGQPQTLQAYEAGLCAQVYDPGCAAIAPLPADLADECVTLDSSCTPGEQGDGGESVDISDEQDNLVVKTNNPTLTTEEWEAYLSGSAGPDLTAKVQYILNANTYTNAVNDQRRRDPAEHSGLTSEGSGARRYSTTNYNTVSIIYTQQINQVYDQLATVGAQSDSVGITFPDSWCKNASDVAACQANVATIQMALNNSISTLQAQKTKLGVDTPYTPPSHAQDVPTVVSTARASGRGCRRSSSRRSRP